MSEPRIHYRIPPCASHDIPAMESWLEDMASQGLHLASDGFFMGLATFEEGPPRREKFRLEATNTNGGLLSEEYSPKDDAVELHRQMGWVYRARRGQFHIYASEDPNAPELNTDPQVQAITMAALTKHLRRSLVSTLSLMSVYALLYFGDLVISAAIYLGTWRVALFAGLVLWDLGRQVRTLVVLSRCLRRLQGGDPLPHRRDYRRRGMRYLAGGAVRKMLWAVLVCTVLTVLLPHLTEERYATLEAFPEPFPFATLEDLYPGAEVDRQNGILESNAAVWSDFLAPENCDFTEYAGLTREGQRFDCYLTVNYHRTRYEWTARLLAKEFISQAGANFFEQTLSKLFGGEPVILTEFDLPQADYAAYYYKDLSDPYLVLVRDNVVLRVRCAALEDAPTFEPEELARLVLSHLR